MFEIQLPGLDPVVQARDVYGAAPREGNLLSGEALREAIVDLVRGSRRFVVLASPYLDLLGWDELLKEIRYAVRRSVPVHVLTRRPGGRAAEDRDHREETDLLIQLGARVVPIHRLHAKVYLNEHHSLITSLNLLSSSRYSIDVGLLTNAPSTRVSALRLLASFDPTLQAVADEASTLALARAAGNAPVPEVPAVSSPPTSRARGRRVKATPASRAASPLAQEEPRPATQHLELANRVEALVRSAQGSRLARKVHRHYIGLRSRGARSFLFRLIPKGDAVEVRLTVRCAAELDALLGTSGLPLVRRGDLLCVPVDAALLRTRASALRRLFSAAASPLSR